MSHSATWITLCGMWSLDWKGGREIESNSAKSHSIVTEITSDEEHSEKLFCKYHTDIAYIFRTFKKMNLFYKQTHREMNFLRLPTGYVSGGYIVEVWD